MQLNTIKVVDQEGIMNFSILKFIKFLFFIFFAIYFTSAFLTFIAFYAVCFCVGVLVTLFYRFSEEDKINDLKELLKKFKKQNQLNNLTYKFAQNVTNTNSVKERFKLFKEYLKNGINVYHEK